MDLDATGFEQRGFVRPGLRAVGGKARVRLAEEVAAHALGRLGGREPIAIHGPSDDLAIDALERLRHRHDRDGRAVPSGRIGDGVDERRRHERTGRVVDKDDAVLIRPGALEARRTRRAPTPAGARHRPRRRRPTTAARRRRPPHRVRSAAVTTTIRATDGAASSAASVQASSGRPAISIASLSAEPPIRTDRPAATTTTSAATVAPRGAQSSRGWAKIIRPATVWRTRVTATSRSRSMCRRAAFDDDHRAVVEEADALARLLALLDDPDAELLAGQDARA